MNTVREFINSCSIRSPDVNFVVLRKRKPTEQPTESGNMLLLMLNSLTLHEAIKLNEDIIKDTLDMEIKHWDMCFKGGNTYFQLWVDIDFKCRLWQ